MIIAQPASRIYRVIGPRRMILTGLLVSGAVTLLLAPLDLDANLWLIRILMLARGLGFGFVLVPLQAATYAQVSSAETGRATALYNATSQVASSFGVAVAAAYLTNRLTHYGAQLGNPATSAGQLDAFQASLLLTGALALAGASVAFLIHDRDAAATMDPRAAGVDDGATVPALH
jgi:sugar phosphate permease